MRARAVWAQYGTQLGVGVSCLFICSPRSWCCSAADWPELRSFPSSVAARGGARVQAVSREGLRIEACALGNGAGRLGAARLALQRLGGMMSND